MNYYYLDSQKNAQGPFSSAELLEKLNSGELSGHTLVATIGGDKWRPLRCLAPAAISAPVGPCPKCRAELRLVDAEVPACCPTCGKQLRPAAPGMLPALRSAWAQLFSPKGRATRSEFWWCVLAGFIASMLFFFLLDLAAQFFPAVTLIIPLYNVALLVAFLCLTIRRLHDVGFSGVSVVIFNIIDIALFKIPLFLLMYHAAVKHGVAGLCAIGLTLVYGGLGLFLFFCTLTDSQRGSNKYGPSSKYPLS